MYAFQSFIGSYKYLVKLGSYYTYITVLSFFHEIIILKYRKRIKTMYTAWSWWCSFGWFGGIGLYIQVLIKYTTAF